MEAMGRIGALVGPSLAQWERLKFKCIKRVSSISWLRRPESATNACIGVGGFQRPGQEPGLLASGGSLRRFEAPCMAYMIVRSVHQLDP